LAKKTPKITTVEAKDDKKVLLSDIYMDLINSDLSKNMTEEQIQKYTLDAYTKVNTSFEKAMKHYSRGNHQFSLNDFLDGAMGRIVRSANITRKYDSAYINKILENPQGYKNDLMRIGMYLYIRVQEYKGILEYKSNMLPYTNILQVNDMSDFDMEKYKRNLQFILDYNIASKFGQATKLLVRDDVYFAYELSDGGGKNFIWKQLPSEYCVILGRDRFETYRVGFDMRYFDMYPQDLESYPDEFKEKYKGYQKFKADNKNKKNVMDFGTTAIVELDTNKAIAFKFDESVDFVLPYFSGLYVDMIRLLEIKDVEMVATISDNYKVVHQLIPLSTEGDAEDDFLLSADYILDAHDSLRANLPASVGGITTAMKLESISLKGNVASSEENIVSKHASNLFSSSGTSKILFSGNSTSSVGLDRNIQVDENMLFKLLRQYERYMNKRLFLYNKGTYKYRLQFLDNTYYNTPVLFDRYLKAGQFGFNTEFEVGAMCGISQLDMINRGSLMEALGIKKKMIPFVSSHTNTEPTDGSDNKKVEVTDEGARSRDRGLTK
jgi:hypothetical protein